MFSFRYMEYFYIYPKYKKLLNILNFKKFDNYIYNDTLKKNIDISE